MTEKRRKAIPDRVKLIVALEAMGLTVEQVEWDHQPPLALREWDPEKKDTIPPANDPVHIQMLRIAEHREKTFGRGGEKRITTAGSDANKIAKVRRLSARQEEFRTRLLERDNPAFLPADHEDRGARRAKKPWPSRPFPKRSKVKP
ncbi:hypothetical protein [uncultured Alsobacter sp.]|uniref:hypothetical protein n=1 Tax=uncultured Alsobacter sp. TaxID=1748258 RepID=UPI0025F96AB2|nr:hypothetical protein [uncultured Alsobacter sp.]